MAHKAGYVNIIGVPNTGKSTLLNALLGEQLVIVNPKAQTTRHRILGILNGEDYQLVLSDTPGILDPMYPMQERMMSAVDEALVDADVLVVMVELGQRPEGSEDLLIRAQRFNGPMVVLVNKVDTGTEEVILAALEMWQAVFPQAKVVPLSALHGTTRSSTITTSSIPCAKSRWRSVVSFIATSSSRARNTAERSRPSSSIFPTPRRTSPRTSSAIGTCGSSSAS